MSWLCTHIASKKMGVSGHDVLKLTLTCADAQTDDIQTAKTAALLSVGPRRIFSRPAYVSEVDDVECNVDDVAICWLLRTLQMLLLHARHVAVVVARRDASFQVERVFNLVHHNDLSLHPRRHRQRCRTISGFKKNVKVCKTSRLTRYPMNTMCGRWTAAKL